MADPHRSPRPRAALSRRARAGRGEGRWLPAALDPAQALRTLDDALALGARCGLLHSLLEVDPLLPELLQAIAGARRTRRRPTTWSGCCRPAAAAAEDLTEREIRILRMLQAGLSNRDLAHGLFLSEATVKWHLHNIHAKLGGKNRTGALALAVKRQDVVS